jgi:hypothetical protein
VVLASPKRTVGVISALLWDDRDVLEGEAGVKLALFMLDRMMPESPSMFKVTEKKDILWLSFAWTWWELFLSVKGARRTGRVLLWTSGIANYKATWASHLGSSVPLSPSE